jgi:hypothetical protein
MILSGGVLFTAEDCVAVDHQVLEAIRLGFQARNRPVPHNLLAMADQIHKCAETCREYRQVGDGAGSSGSCTGADRSASLQEPVKLTVREAAYAYSVSETFLRQLCRQERVLATRTSKGGAWQIDDATLRSYLSTRKERN